jgi:penicillin-binding protein 1B
VGRPRGRLINRLLARRWFRRALMGVGALSAVVLLLLVITWIRYGRLIDAGLAGEHRPMPRVYGRSFELHAGAALSPAQLAARLDDIGYASRENAEQPGEFALAGQVVQFTTRPAPDRASRAVRVEFSKGNTPAVTKLTDSRSGRAMASVELEAPLLAALAPGQKQRRVPIESIPKHVRDAVLAIEDKRFFSHPGVDPIRAAGAVFTNLWGDRPYLEGASTITQQIVKNMFLTPDKTYRRKLQEQFMALVLESRYSKEQILELYLNTVTLGQRGPFEIHGVAEGARVFFGKDLSNISLAEAATMAGLIQSPSRLSPFRWPDRARERRDVVLREMADAGLISRDDAKAASDKPLRVEARSLDNDAAFFVDYVSQLVEEQFASSLKKDAALDVYTTLDLEMQRLAQKAVDDGLAGVDKQVGRRRAGRAQAALVAVDPRTGDVLAMVGGRSYTQSQLNRAKVARRQPGSAFKPFVYLAAFELMAATGRNDITPATIEVDEPSVFKDGETDYVPSNYQNEYDGPITLRRALALSRNIVAIRVAEKAGYGQVADLWQRVGVGTPAKPYPSIALGVFEASPLEMATAYTVFTNEGSVRPLRAVTRLVDNGKSKTIPVGAVRAVARADTTFLVTNMMQSVINEGTGAAARSSFRRTAAGKSGTTNDLRDAWFIGFTPDLLTVVWVGLDDNQPIGLSGSQAALPIWTAFMRTALAGQPDRTFVTPPGVAYVQIDKDTGLLALPNCPRQFNESFLAGTEPRQYCDVHGGFFGRLGAWLKRIGG